MQQQKQMKYYVLVKDLPIQVQRENIEAAASVASIIRTCLGPRAMQKMVITRIGSLELTNDGNSILREIDATHPAAKFLIELARTQDDNVGDGTTTVIILAAELLQNLFSLLTEKIHPVLICNSLQKILEKSLAFYEDIAVDIGHDATGEEGIDKTRLQIINGSIGTKLCTMLGVDIASLALKAVKIVYDEEKGIKRCDLTSYARVEKIIGGEFKECQVLNGIILNKNIIHAQMRKRIQNPRIVIMDCPFEYKKGESQTNFEFYGENDFSKALAIEEEQVKAQCEYVIALKPDIVVTEKGISDLAMSIFHSNNITALRRLKKTETSRLSKACGAKVVSRAEDLEEKHVGKGCGLFEYVKLGDEYYCKFVECDNPKACSIVLRGPSRDILNELERNFYDAVKVAKNIFITPKLCPGGGATEMALSKYLSKCTFGSDVEKKVTECVSESLKIIPSVLAANSGMVNPLNVIAQLEKKEDSYWGVNGETGEIADTRSIIMEPLSVKTQALKSAIEAASLLIRVDGIIQGSKVKN
ncbi:T-complex protein 1 subunit gamma [Astathelohania contejeani]|uniref:T-complex protein 1 subunit gamma n=1 Tax=Astathelohania contejeani TaxID=164912 RepID=A0ABQ7HW81_9MICR|nr:T-complex protein 1 subunit gamma [Thelohania contejeani]